MRTMVAGVLITLALGAAAPAPEAAGKVASLERLAAAGNAEATYHLGMAHHLGLGVPADPGKAFAAFRRAAEAGDPLAAYKLGCFYDGQGGGAVARDPAAALRWKLVAAEAGYALAQHDVAAILFRQNREAEATGWLERAAAQGLPMSLAALATMHARPGQDRARAAAYFRLLVQQTGGSTDLRAKADALEAALTPEQRASARAFVAAYRAQPTPLTIKAKQGARAADALLASTR